MRNAGLLTWILLLAGALLGQQAGATGQQKSQPKGANTAAQTVQGCLSGTSNSYTLAADNGTLYRLHGADKLLSQYVGHEVAVTATAGGSSASAAASSSGDAAHAVTENSLQVSDVKDVSDHCNKATPRASQPVGGKTGPKGTSVPDARAGSAGETTGGSQVRGEQLGSGQQSRDPHMVTPVPPEQAGQSAEEADRNAAAAERAEPGGSNGGTLVVSNTAPTGSTTGSTGQQTGTANPR
jgi:hypothetical protein